MNVVLLFGVECLKCLISNGGHIRMVDGHRIEAGYNLVCILYVPTGVKVSGGFREKWKANKTQKAESSLKGEREPPHHFARKISDSAII